LKKRQAVHLGLSLSVREFGFSAVASLFVHVRVCLEYLAS
jgi:hypothetical protein